MRKSQSFDSRRQFPEQERIAADSERISLMYEDASRDARPRPPTFVRVIIVATIALVMGSPSIIDGFAPQAVDAASVLYVPYPADEPGWYQSTGTSYPPGSNLTNPCDNTAKHIAWENCTRPVSQLGVANDFAISPPNCASGIDTAHHVLAMASGTVLNVSSFPWLAIDHGGGMIGFYMHVANITVKQGDPVTQDTKLGNPSLLGGGATGCHVHVAFATYTTAPKVGGFNPDSATWSSTFPSLTARQASSPNVGSIGGTVKITGTNSPLGGATVNLSGTGVSPQSTTTGSDGGYLFTGVRAGSATITAGKSNYTTGSVNLTVQGNASNRAPDIFLGPSPGGTPPPPVCSASFGTMKTLSAATMEKSTLLSAATSSCQPPPSQSCDASIGPVLYTGDSYTGTCHAFPPGSYNLQDFGLDGKVASILDQGSKWGVSTWENPNFTGNPGRFDSSVPQLTGFWRTGMRSIKVEVHSVCDKTTDTTAPTFTVNTTSTDGSTTINGWWHAKTVTSVTNVQDTGCGSNHITVETNLDNAGWQSYVSPVSITNEGKHILQVRATDGVGNVNLQSYNINMDWTPPKTTLTLTVNVSRTSTAATLTGAITLVCQDNLSGCDTSYYIPKGATQPVKYTGPFVAVTQTYPACSTINQSFSATVTAYSVDIAGNKEFVNAPSTVSTQVNNSGCITSNPPPSGPPAVPTLVFPANGASVTTLTPTLTWQPVSGATQYQIQVSSTSTFSLSGVTGGCARLDSLPVTTTSYTPSPALCAHTVFYYRVQAVGQNGITSAWSEVRSFKTP